MKSYWMEIIGIFLYLLESALYCHTWHTRWGLTKKGFVKKIGWSAKGSIMKNKIIWLFRKFMRDFLLYRLQLLFLLLDLILFINRTFLLQLFINVQGLVFKYTIFLLLFMYQNKFSWTFCSHYLFYKRPCKIKCTYDPSTVVNFKVSLKRPETT